jgi:hypothetical protein
MKEGQRKEDAWGEEASFPDAPLVVFLLLALAGSLLMVSDWGRSIGFRRLFQDLRFMDWRFR